MYLIFKGVVCKVKKKFYKTVKVEKNDITYLDRCFFVDYYILETQKSTERHGTIFRRGFRFRQQPGNKRTGIIFKIKKQWIEKYE